MKKYTVNEVSKILSISRQTVYNKITNPIVKPYVKKLDGKTYIEIDTLEQLCKIFDCPIIDTNSQFENNNQNMDKESQEDINVIDVLLQENQFIKQQLVEKDIQIEKHIKLLENMQVLLKDTKEQVHLLEDDKNKNKKGLWNFWKRG